MHLLIDIRSSGATDRAHIHYALLWADYWKQIHPQDTITFLCYEGDHIHRDNVVTISRKWSLFGNKNLSNHSHGPDRIVYVNRLIVRIRTISKYEKKSYEQSSNWPENNSQ